MIKFYILIPECLSQYFRKNKEHINETHTLFVYELEILGCNSY